MSIPLPPRGSSGSKIPKFPTPVKPHTPTVPQRIVNKSENKNWPGPSGSKSKLDNSDRVYQIRVALKGGGISAFVTLVHAELMKQDELNAAIAEAVKVVNEVRIPARRKEMADNRTPVPDLKQMNEQGFKSDVEFFEAVMCDKFGFRRMLTMNGSTEIVKTGE